MPPAYLDPQEWMWGLVDRSGSKLRRTRHSSAGCGIPPLLPQGHFQVVCQDFSHPSPRPQSVASISSGRTVLWPSPLPDRPS